MVFSQQPKIYQIVPRLPPTIDGVGDYALNLARQLRQDFDLDTHFIVGDRTWSGVSEIDGFAVSQLNTHSPATLLTQLQNNPSATILLHYVGYGYAKRGCPTWLVNALEQWKASHPTARLVTMFHEVYASGPLWTSTFWLSALQKDLAARLARVSDRLLTSKELYAEILQQLIGSTSQQHPDKPVLTLPVFSTIGEPNPVSPLAERAKHLIVFGGRSNRQRVYQHSQVMLNQACQTLNIEKIFDVGLSTGLALSSIGDVPIIELGQQPAAELSDLLTHALAGFFDYPTDFLAKSTIFAAYCAHGVLPISAHANAVVIDGIMAQKHYWVPDSQFSTTNIVEIQAIAQNAYDWYQTHTLATQAKLINSHLLNSL